MAWSEEERKLFKRGAPYVWTMIQTLLIMKIAILYFGQSMSVEPTPGNIALFVLTVLFSFGSLIFFAYRKGKQSNEHEDN